MRVLLLKSATPFDVEVIGYSRADADIVLSAIAADSILIERPWVETG